MKISHLLLAASLGFSGMAAPFRNLDFQSPNIAAVVSAFASGKPLQIVDGIPGWQLMKGNAPVSFVSYNTGCLTCPGASLYGPEKPKRGDKFSFFIYAGGVSFNPLVLTSESVLQVGNIPRDAHSLQFVADIGPEADLLHVYLGGEKLSVVTLEPVGFGYRFGADVTAWAGKTAELRFTAEPGPAPTYYSGTDLGNIRFSPDALITVPEPSTWALLGVGGVLLLWVAKRPPAT